MTETTERCAAILKYIHHWRCSRAAVSERGLCAQHERGGAMVPASWDHTPRDYQKFACNPQLPFRRLPPARDTLTGSSDERSENG